MPHLRSEKPAVTIYPSGRRLTHGQLTTSANQFARLLMSAEKSNKGRVAFLLGNQIEYPVVVCGARKAGFDHLPLNTHSPAHELLEILRQFRPQVVVVSDQYLTVAQKLRRQLNHVRFVVTGSAPSGWDSYDQLMETQSTTPVVDRSSGRLLLLSGGSTGTPKIVVRPPAPVGSVLSFLPLANDSTFLLPAPLYHSMPMSWLVAGLEAGLHVVIMQRWRTEWALEAIDRYAVTVVALVPTMMSRLLDMPQRIRASYNLSRLKAIVHGAAPCPVHVKQGFLEWLPPSVEVYEVYGASEGIGRCHIGRKAWLRRPKSVGLPAPGSRVIIRDEEGRELPAGGIGVIWFARADGARMSYLGNPNETARIYNRYGEGSVGDMGYVDADGYLYLTGRRKNMLIVGGVNVYPDRITDVLAAHPAIQDVAVTGLPHPDLAEVPVALVELRPGFAETKALTDGLTAWCRARLSSTACPRQFIVVDTIPRLATGKLDLRALPPLVG